MAESAPPAPPIPRSTMVMDLVTQTPWSTRRNRFYFSTDTPPPGIAELEACCNRVFAVYTPILAPLMTTQIRMLRMEGRWYGAGTTGFEANSTTAAVPGLIAAVTPGSETDEEESVVADTLPDEVSIIVQKRTGNTGPGNFGRWFFCGLSEMIQNAGQVDLEYRPMVKTAANVFSLDITVSAGFATVLHARHWNKKENTMQPITKCYSLMTMGSRRDRRRPLRLERL